MIFNVTLVNILTDRAEGRPSLRLFIITPNCPWQLTIAANVSVSARILVVYWTLDLITVVPLYAGG